MNIDSGAGYTFESVVALPKAAEALKHADYHGVVVDATNNNFEIKDLLRFIHQMARSAPRTSTLVIADVNEPRNFPNGTSRCHWIRGSISDSAVITQLFDYLEMDTCQRQFADDSDVLVPLEIEGLLAVSMPMREVIQQVLEAASVDAPVLITGETGTGKDLVAAAIHKRSARKSRNFVPINMGALPSELVASELFGHEKGAYTGANDQHLGIFEQASEGSVFLDEITTMDERTQVALLRVLETNMIRRVGGKKDIRINARIIAASNENLEEVVKSNRFREDLYYRLDVFRIHLPPLRERPGGVSILTNHFISRFAAIYKKNIRVVAPEVYSFLRNYSWPGNVRELKNVVQRAIVKAQGTDLTANLLPTRIREANGLHENKGNGNAIHLGLTLEELEKQYITATLSSLRGNKVKTAVSLGISRRTLYDKLKKYGIL